MKPNSTNTAPVRNAAKTVMPMPTWQLWLLAVGLALISWAVLSPVLSNGFINQDDDIYVYNNRQLGKPLVQSIPYFFGPHYFSGNYVPLTMALYAVVYHSEGDAPEGYHRLSLLLHAANVLLVFWLALLLSGRKTVVAAVVALFFGIHPMHVESVAWAAELKDVLYGFFFLAAMITYYRYLALHISTEDGRDGMAPRRSYALLWLAACFVLFVLSALSKPAAVILPMVLLTLDYYMARKPSLVVVIEKLPFFVVSVVMGIVALRAQQADELINNQFGLGERILFVLAEVPMYLFKFLAPLWLSNFYPLPVLHGGHLPLGYYAAPLADALLVYAVWRTAKHTRVVAFGMLFFVVNLLLVLQLVPVGNAIIADRYTYMAYTGLLFVVAMGFDRLWRHADERTKVYRQAAIVLLLAGAAGCAYASFSRCAVWENKDTLSEDVLTKFPNDPIALNNRGFILMEAHEYQRAVPLLERAIALKPVKVQPDFVKAYINLANCYLAMKDAVHAGVVTEDALRYAPNDHNVINMKGCVLGSEGRNAEALVYFRQALAMKKDDINVYLNLSRCYYDLKDYARWNETVDSGLKYVPGDFMLENLKGYYLYLNHDYSHALYWFKASLEQKPGFETAAANLAACNRAISDSLQQSNVRGGRAQ